MCPEKEGLGTARPVPPSNVSGPPPGKKATFNRGYPCFGFAAIFAGMLNSVQIIQKCSTRNTIHVSIV